VLTIDPKNEKVLAILDGLNRRARLKTVGLGALAAIVIAGGAFAIHQKNKPPEPQPPPDPSVQVATNLGGPSTNVANQEPAPIEEIDAGVDPSTQNGSGATNGGSGAVVIHTPNQGSNAPPQIDAGPTVVPPVEIAVSVPVAGAEWRLPGGEWRKVTGRSFTVPVDGPLAIEVQHDLCQAVTVNLDRNTQNAFAPLLFKPASLKPTCPGVKDVSVGLEWTAAGKVEKRALSVDSSFSIPFGDDATSSTRTVTVTFSDSEHTDTQKVTLTAGKTKEVACKLAP